MLFIPVSSILKHTPSIADSILTDLKVDNILVGFENPSVIKDFAHAQASNPMLRKTKDGRSIYLSHNNFGKLRSFYILPKITDFGLAQQQEDIPQLQRHPIQPDHYRAPEVILGAGWAYSVDIWNLGVLVCHVLVHTQASNPEVDLESIRESRFVSPDLRPTR